MGEELLSRINALDSDEALVAVEVIQSSTFKAADIQSAKTTRYAELNRYQLIKSWEGPASSRLYRDGDTVLFIFDSFQNDAIPAFKWSLDYAAQNNVKKFMIDISCNNGGSTGVVMYMMGIITNAEDHSNRESIRCLNTVTGIISSSNYEVDLNLDGKYDDLDNKVIYNFEFGIITSHISYSCGNLLPVMAKDRGIPIFGQTSGGGSCMLSVFKTPEERFYTLSGFNKFINNENFDADVGAAVNYDLTKTVTAEDGTETVDYSGFYDLGNLSALMDEYYGIPEDSSKDVSPEEDSSKSDSSQNEPVVSPGNKTFNTGNSGSIWTIIPVMLCAVCLVMTAFRRKKENNR